MNFYGFEIDPEKLPVHVGIIMDGNGRWANKKGLPRFMGHQQGFFTLKKLMEFNRKMGIKIITVYAFSTENWNRPQEEVDFLMSLVRQIIPEYTDELLENDIQLRVTGSMKGVPAELVQEIETSIKRTADCKSYIFNVAFNYGGRREIADAMTAIAQKVACGELTAGQIDENTIAAHLYQPDIPDADLIIRTSGEYRLSNFLLWKSAYSELYITRKLWPDFGPKDFSKAIYDFQNRKRRFGRVSDDE